MTRKVLIDVGERMATSDSGVLEQCCYRGAQLYLSVTELSPGVTLTLAVHVVIGDTQQEIASTDIMTTTGVATLLLGETSGVVLPSSFVVKVTHAGDGSATYSVLGDLF